MRKFLGMLLIIGMFLLRMIFFNVPYTADPVLPGEEGYSAIVINTES